MPSNTNVTVRVPGPLRSYAGSDSTLPVKAATVQGVLDELERRHPALHRNVCDETGAVRRHVNVFVNSANVRDTDGLDTPVADGDVVTILPAVSGG